MKSAPQNKFASEISSCRCCGTCCKKGGPAFHEADRPLIEKGIIQLRYLFTIRAGELAYDPIRGGLLPVNSEIIKIKSHADRGVCTFYVDRSGKCRIYADRPLECRRLKCWDTQAIEEMYERDRLSRKDILENVAGLWELVADHEKRCGYGRLGYLISKLKKGDKEHWTVELSESINYDSQLRRLVIEECRLEPEMLDLIFGRPLEKTIMMFGLRMIRDEGKIILTPCGPSQSKT